MAEPTSLYRRFRPQRFAEVRGQDFVVSALRNAVRDGTVAHAYLLSGPRGTGKTTSARLLAKALNCTDRQPDGDCCDACPSCVAIREGGSLDVIELDAASNRKIEDVRNLLSSVAFGSPGERKVYIIDEVHQLTKEAESTLLKTLEEPPEHVLFVMATTDPDKVSDTIRSRTQHFSLRLFGADELGSLVHDIVDKAGIVLDERSIEAVVREGRGSARDTLSALEQIAAAGGVRDEAPVISHLVDGLAARDAGAVLVAVAEGLRAGHDPRRLGAELIERLRWCFLSLLAPDLVDCLDHERAEIAEQARRLGPAATTRTIEVAGEALVDLRESVDPRVTLEAALVRCARPELDTSPAALVQRIERLERGDVTATPAAAPAGASPPAASPARPSNPPSNPGAPNTPAPPSTPPSGAGASGAPPAGRPSGPAAGQPDASPAGRPAAAPKGPAAVRAALDSTLARSTEAAPTAQGPAGVRAALGAIKGTAKGAPASRPEPAAAPDPHSPAPPVPERAAAAPAAPVAAPAAGGFPTREELVKAWGDSVLPGLKPGPKSRFGQGRFVAVEGGTAVFGVENEPMRKACEDRKGEVEAALASAFGRPVPLRIVVDTGGRGADDASPAAGIDPRALSDGDDVDLTDLVDAPPSAATDPTSLLMEAFPGTEELA